MTRRLKQEKQMLMQQHFGRQKLDNPHPKAADGEKESHACQDDTMASVATFRDWPDNGSGIYAVNDLSPSKCVEQEAIRRTLPYIAC